jgi:uncharacterized protein (TIGR02145 family)
MHYKKVILRIICLILIHLIHFSVYTQEKVFTLLNEADNRISINKTFNSSTHIKPFTVAKPISGLAISCDINLKSDTSLVRIILIDKDYKEFLICETYSWIADSNKVSLKEYGEETASLNNIIPNSLRIEINNASVYLKEVLASKQEKFVGKATVERSQKQNSEKIKQLNKIIKKKGGLWIAGETSVSKMTFEEKKELFGGIVPNLQGFEYYVGGVFAMPGALESEINVQDYSEQFSLLNASPFADEFSWKNRHGQDWVTPVKNQGSCGSCWAFAAIGATELLVNLYYNRHLDLDLSEQDAVSCFGSLSGSCAGGDAGAALDYIRDFGVTTETCFPYAGWDEPCINKCINPSEIIKIGGREYSQWLTDSIAKKMIIEGPVSCAVSSAAHIMTLVGYKVIKEGDNIFNIIIPASHPYIGRTAWLLKNSWGEDWGDEGYLYSLSNVDNLRFSELFSPISSLKFNDSDIACLDEDSDGYYNWGIGPKPPHCPPCPDKPDGDDSNPCLGPMDEFGNIHFFTQIPSARDVTVLAGDIVPPLTAEGENIRWYGDNKRISLLHTGNSFTLGQSTPGIHTYYVTQTLSGCESDILPVKLTIYLEVPPPIAENVNIYAGEPTPTLFAFGENIKWYGDPKNPLYDSRDEQTYKTTLIGNQLWMAENLNYYTSTGSLYYDNDSLSYAQTYGRLYYLNATVDVCPLDWHLPSDQEWIELEMYLGMNKEETHNQALRGAGIGSKLKEAGTLHWGSPNEYATNEVGFSARPAGSYEYEFWGLRNYTGFFALAEYYSTAVYLRTLDINNDKIGRSLMNSDYPIAYSVRCISCPSKPLSEENSYKPIYRMPGKYAYFVTQTVSGFESPADTVIFTILSEVPPPDAENITVCENNQIPDLFAEGKNIKWYSDANLSNLLHSGNSCTTGKTLPGIYKYYVTQTIGDCRSKADTITLTIIPVPLAPVTQDVSVCNNQPAPELTAAGENIRWYSDSLLTNLVHSGSSFSSGQTEPGKYRFYITQTIAECVSEYSTFNLLINPLPAIILGDDTTIFRDRSIILGPFNNSNFYSWYDGSVDPYYEISGNKIGLGYHIIWVIVTDTNACIYSDTIAINVVKCAVYSTLNAQACERYTSPSGKYTWTKSGAYHDTIPNAGGCDSVITVNLTIISADTSVTQNLGVLTANASGATYRWINCDNGYTPINGETRQTFSPSTTDHYAVIISQNGCTDTSSCFSIMMTEPAKSTFKQSITLYPNPNDGSFSIDLGRICQKAEITIIEPDGRVIRKEYSYNNRLINLQMSVLPGMYMAIITSEYERAVLKILKK